MRIIVSILSVWLLGAFSEIKKCNNDTYNPKKVPCGYTTISYKLAINCKGDTIKILSPGEQIQYTLKHLK